MTMKRRERSAATKRSPSEKIFQIITLRRDTKLRTTQFKPIVCEVSLNFKL